MLRPPKHASPHHRRVAGSRTQAQSRGNRATATLVLSRPAPLPSPARVLLRKAQKVVEADAALSGKRPTIMDVILNAKAPVSAYSEDIVMEAVERSEAAFRARHDYAFGDSDGVEQYGPTRPCRGEGGTKTTGSATSGLEQISRVSRAVHGIVAVGCGRRRFVAVRCAVVVLCVWTTHIARWSCYAQHTTSGRPCG
ncbi:uncharacterized protein B0H18DRAFT_290343 [Fomitopsis serialis]|uniref:uncharacterized protein n=1 Tax=Fomitopsis serialis TaxID=139415 RepID=UPI002007B9FE|nr:uncharacterized protein B0H18DRAFT_290343 [Neoantrodia serialis]KAH9927222.1 hypothetical protein B0H18DRAFT_290343 [Neoantrodia serialis]